MQKNSKIFFCIIKIGSCYYLENISEFQDKRSTLCKRDVVGEVNGLACYHITGSGCLADNFGIARHF